MTAVPQSPPIVMVRLGVRVTKKTSVTSERERSSPGAPEPDSDDTGIMMQ